MIRLIASDLDGTLLDGEGRLPPRAFHIIRRLGERGILFAAASGRQYGNLQRMFFPVQKEMAFLCENGALVVARGCRHEERFPRPLAEAIIRDILDAGMELLISLPESSYLLSSAEKAYTDDVIYRLRNTATIIDDPLLLADRCIKISGFHPLGMEGRGDALRDKWQGRAQVALGGDCWLDFTLGNKRTGLAVLSRALGIPFQDMMAFGDHFNDQCMLEAVGHPFLMETAPPGMRAQGFPTCKNVLDTVERLLASPM